MDKEGCGRDGTLSASCLARLAALASSMFSKRDPAFVKQSGQVRQPIQPLDTGWTSVHTGAHKHASAFINMHAHTPHTYT